MQLSKKELHELLIQTINETVNNTQSNTNGYGITVDYQTIYKNLGLISAKTDKKNR
jgi:hypothetical protein